MNIIVLTPIRLLGDGLTACINQRSDMMVIAVVGSLESLRQTLGQTQAHLVLVDVTQGIELIDIREILVQWPGIHFVALGLTEIRQEVLKCGRAGFSGYISREATVDGLCQALEDVAAGRQACPPEICGGMLRALFRSEPVTAESLSDPALTRREREVLDLIGRGLSNKEIGKELSLSIATVKHHVHNVLEKLGLSRRAEAMRTVRDHPWMGAAFSHRR